MNKIFQFNDKNNRRKLVFDVWHDSDMWELESQLNSEIVKGDADFNITFHMDKYDEDIIKQMDVLSKKMPANLHVDFTIEDRGSKMKCSDLEKFIDLEESLKNDNHALYFNGGIDDYELSEVINAQEQIESFSKGINSLDASPLEKYLIIYDFVTNRVYTKNDLSTSKSRDIIAVLNGNDIVCVGYAQMLQRLCKEAGIECFMQSCEVRSKFNNQFIEGHANNLVKIKDEKYGIDGLFYADACWDSVKRGKEHEKTFAYALLPLSDKERIKYAKIDVYDKSMYGGRKESVECDHVVLGELDKYGIDTKEREFVDKKNYLDYRKRRKALNRVEKIFRAYNIPADVYLRGASSTNICEFNRFVALCMEDKVDEARLKESIDALVKVVESKENDSVSEPLLDFVDEKHKDIYKTIEDLRTAENKIESSHYEWNEGYTINDVIRIIETEGAEAARQKTGVRKVTTKIKPEIPYLFKSVMESHEEILMGRRINNDLQKFLGNEQIVSIDTLKKGLRRSYELRGMSPEKIDYEVERAVNDTVAKAKEAFEHTATNCFSVEANAAKAWER